MSADLIRDRELGEISDKLKELLNTLRGCKSYRDGGLIKQTKREIRNLSKRRRALLAKLHKQGVNSSEHLPT